MNENIKNLTLIQEIDIYIDLLISRQNEIPEILKRMKDDFLNLKNKYEESKKNLNKNLLLKKEKQAEIESVNQEIAKHEKELNVVKSNDAYKALIKSIADLKIKKSEIETQLIELMYNDDQINEELKLEENELKSMEKKLNNDIIIFENELNEKKEQQILKENEKKELLINIDSSAIAKYEKVRKKKQNGIAVTAVISNNCSGCHMSVTPQIISDLMADKDIVLCDNCSRILYLTDN